jgi:hypothetical protein
MASEAFSRAIEAIVTEMIRQNVITPDLLESAAKELEAAGEGEAAYQVQCIQIEAGAQRTTEWQQQQIRKRIHAVPDGGSRPASG